MKKRNSMTTKRIGMGGIFLRKLPWALVISGVICAVALTLLNKSIGDTILSYQTTFHHSMLTGIEKEFENYGGENFEERLAGHLCLFYNRGVSGGGWQGLWDSAMMAQAEAPDGRKLVPEETKYILTMRHGGSTPTEYFFCDEADFGSADKEIIDAAESDEETAIDIDSVYLDREKRTFLPSDTPAADAESRGMEYVLRDPESSWIVSRMDFDTGSDIYRKVMSRNQFADYTEISDGFETGTRFTDKVIAPDGGVYTVYLAQYKDYGSDFYKQAAGICAAVVAAILLITALSAWRTSVIYKSHYAMEDYRREMTNTMAHDLKSPLMAISGCAEMLSNGCDYDKCRRYGEVILSNVNYMNDIISNVLELAKLEGGKKPVPEDIELGSLTESLMEKYSQELTNHGIKSSISGSYTVKADRLMLSQALDNLISNAVKYTPDGGSIDIAIANGTLTVGNDCAEETSVPDEDLWKPFVKGDSARSSEKGSGIGLSIVRSICDAHGFSAELERHEGRFGVRVEFGH